MRLLRVSIVNNDVEDFQHKDLRFEPYNGEKLPECFEYEPLDNELVEFYNIDAEKYQNESMTKVRNVFYQNKLVGYYAYTSSEIRKYELNREDKVAPFAHPAIKLGRLLVCKSMRKKGVGKAIVQDLISIALKVRQDLPLRFLVVDSKPNSVGFYLKLGFINPQIKAKFERHLTLLYFDLNIHK